MHGWQDGPETQDGVWGDVKTHDSVDALDVLAVDIEVKVVETKGKHVEEGSKKAGGGEC